MAKAWTNYQVEAANFFKSLGFDADVEQTVEGVRGKHKVDVWVVGRVHGISFKWVVECKCWKSNIPKEKVMALFSIVQDLGADRGFLLSELGFQSGAIRAANNSNITLTSISDLQENANESILEVAAAKLHLKISGLKNRLWRLHKRTDEYYSDFMRPLGQLAILEMAIGDAFEDKFPTVFAISEDDERLTASNWGELLDRATALVRTVENYIEGNQKDR